MRTFVLFLCVSSVYSAPFSTSATVALKKSVIVGESVKRKAITQVVTASSGFFIKNEGQWDAEALYLARCGNLHVWVTKTGLVYEFLEPHKFEIAKHKDELPDLSSPRQSHVVRMKLDGANAMTATAACFGKKAGSYHYSIGGEKSKWQSNASLYSEVLVKNIYDGVDMRVYFDAGFPRFDFVVQPNGNAKAITLQMEGTESVNVNNNSIEFSTVFGTVSLKELTAYQMQNGAKKQVPSRFKMKQTAKQGQIRFELGDYQRGQVLMIDPIIWSRFLGGYSEDRPYTVAVSGSETPNVYVAGISRSSNFPKTIGPSFAGGEFDVYVTKLDANGEIIYSRFIGGSDYDGARGLAIDSSGNVIIAGYSASSNFPKTLGSSYSGGVQDIIVTKFDSSGAIVYSRFLGGSGYDEGSGIASDKNGNVYVSGVSSGGYPITMGAYNGGLRDIVVTKLNPNGAIVYSRYIGGSDEDYATDIAVDIHENAYITGFSRGGGYPITMGNPYAGGAIDIPITKLDSNGAIVYSRYLGGNGDDYANGIAVDSSGNAYISAFTDSNNFPTTAGMSFVNNGEHHIVVAKLTPSGELNYSCYLCGTGSDVAYRIAIDAHGSAYVTGYVSQNYPTTAGMSFAGGQTDAVLTQIDANGEMSYSCYLGGSNNDGGLSVAVDQSGYIYVTGFSLSPDFPTTAGVSYAGGSDTFVAKLSIDNIPTATFKKPEPLYYVGGCLNFKDASTHNPTKREWSCPGANPEYSAIAMPTFCFPNKGIYSITLISYNVYGADTLTHTVSILDAEDYFLSVKNSQAISLDLNISPNPAHGQVSIEATTPFENGTLEIYTLLGQKVWQESTQAVGKHAINFNAENFGSGMYVAVLRNNGNSVVKSFWIEK